ncbi:unnamed protein product [Linum trigynum]|uniref:DUF7135 domain-containing protein n=1 Tax=Linum trigynum TaxID=586398 RepID=A0AAV2FMY1_9ROSI
MKIEGTSHSREDADLSDSDDYHSETEDRDEEEEEYEDVHYDAVELQETPQTTSSNRTIDEIDTKLKSLKLKYGDVSQGSGERCVKLYLHLGGNSPKAKWIVSEKSAPYAFVKSGGGGEDDEDEGGSSSGGGKNNSFWILRVGAKVRARVSTEMQLKMFVDQRRVDFVDSGVWALRFSADEEFRRFVNEYHDCLFENVYGLKATEENKVKVYVKEFIRWAKPETADNSMWEDAEAGEEKFTPLRANQDLMEEFEEAANGGVHSLTLGALDNSFLVNDLGVQVYRNNQKGIHGKGICVIISFFHFL